MATGTGLLLFGTGIYTLVILAIGFWTGHAFGEQRERARNPSNRASEQARLERRFELRRRLELAEIQSAAEQVSQRTSRVQSLASSIQLSDAEPLKVAMERLVEATQELSEKLAASNRTVPRHEPVRSPVIERRKTAAEHLTVDEVLDFARPTPDAEPAHSENAPRYAYRRRQCVAPWKPGEAFPSPDAFHEVECKDISVGGISYFTHEHPGYRSLVISIGNTEAPIFMACEIVHTRVAAFEGNVGYLVGCKFSKRLEAPRRHQSRLVASAT